MLLDERTNERTGRACAAAGKPGMTVIATQQEPSTMLVEADGIFVAPDPEAARTLFPARYDAEQVADR
ncbi:hypothetical protein [Streptomyces cyanogenus]|uniref:Uncharacterized protein n=1 Tax=Streptomyces cyanogenus TaxID=80860 RepID=A0ABX7U568_STRCY|nr:hypothetical protein [Streptomyces cyanogenus]QTE02977.1 hypothetical protein S1361_36925 [Streptomyces cyanogenus]